MKPICEAKFSNNSYGFRPNRSVEHAINRTYTMLQMMNLHYVIEFDETEQGLPALIYGEQRVSSLPIQDITGEHIDTDNEYMYYYSVEFVK